MATQYEIELLAKTDAAVRQVANLQKEVERLNEEVKKGNENTKEGLKQVETASKSTAGSVRKIGVAIKAAGIGLLVAAFAQFKEILQQNQTVADTFAITFETLSIAFNDFFRFIEENVGTVTGFFKSIFEDPKQSLIDFANAFKRNIQERFESYLDTLGFLASAVKKVFSGDFAGALEDVKNAGKESLDVLTGVDGTFEKSVETVGKVTKAVTEYTKSTIKSAKENVELEKTARRAGVELQGLIEKFDKRAEVQRQIRDDESKSIKDRIEANQKLSKILDEQQVAMRKAAQDAVDAAQAQLDKNEKNIDLQIALKQAQNDLAGVEAQITGFRSEQLTNTNSLLREQVDIQNELALIGSSNLQLQITEANQAYEAKKLLIEREVEDEQERAKKLSDIELERDRIVQNAKLDMAKNTLGNIAKALGENSKAGKAFAAAQALINTYQGISAELATKTATPFEFAIKLANIASTAAIGFKSVKDILKTNPKTAGSQGGSVPRGTGATPQAPAFNVVGSSGIDQIATALNEQGQQPVQAYVVANDVTSAQSLDRNILTGASLGG